MSTIKKENLNVINKYNNVTVVMESTSVYHLTVENYFRSKGVKTIVMNPVSVIVALMTAVVGGIIGTYVGVLSGVER